MEIVTRIKNLCAAATPELWEADPHDHNAFYTLSKANYDLLRIARITMPLLAELVETLERRNNCTYQWTYRGVSLGLNREYDAATAAVDAARKKLEEACLK